LPPVTTHSRPAVRSNPAESAPSVVEQSRHCLAAVGDEQAVDLGLEDDGVRCAHRRHGLEMRAGPEVEHLERAVIFGGEEQAVAGEIVAEMVEVAGIARELGSSDDPQRRGRRRGTARYRRQVAQPGEARFERRTDRLGLGLERRLVACRGVSEHHAEGADDFLRMVMDREFDLVAVAGRVDLQLGLAAGNDVEVVLVGLLADPPDRRAEDDVVVRPRRRRVEGENGDIGVRGEQLVDDRLRARVRRGVVVVGEFLHQVLDVADAARGLVAKRDGGLFHRRLVRPGVVREHHADRADNDQRHSYARRHSRRCQRHNRCDFRIFFHTVLSLQTSLTSQ